MKNIIAKSIIALAILGSVAMPATLQAQSKVGIIDLRKVFDNYYKTKQADVLLKDEASDLEKQRKGMIDDYKKRDVEYKELIDKANDQAVSAEERAKNKQSAEKKLIELRDNEQAITEFERAARGKLAEKQRIKRDAILVEIRAVIDTKAKAAGYSLVLDTAAESINNTPVVLFNSGENDLTEPVLTQLNQTAPPTTPKSDDKTEKKEAAPADTKSK